MTETDLHHLPPFYRSILLNLSNQTSLPCDQLNLMLLLFINSIFGCIYRRYLKETYSRYLFGMITGFFSMYSLYGIRDSFGLLLFILMMYPITTKYRNPRLVFWICQITLFITLGYVWYYYYLVWRIDFTTSLMGITVRLNTLTHDLYDSDLINSNKNKDQDYKDQDYETIFGKRKTIRNYRIKHACNHNITLFTYLSYMLFFVHCLCGSNLTINEFLYISDQSVYQRNGWKNNKNNKINKLPEPSWKVLINCILQIILSAAIFVFTNTLLPMERAYNLPQTMPLLKKLFLISIYGYSSQFKYHFAWNVLDLTSLTSGAAFSGCQYDENNNIIQIHWERAKNINSFKMLFPQYSAQITRNWNMTINHWLTFYVFYRCNPPKWMENLLGNRASKMLLTRITAAAFHGVYIGYYIFFPLSYIFTVAIDELRETLPTFEKMENKSSIHAFLVFTFWTVVINFNFGLTAHWATNLNTPQVIKMMQNIHYIPIWILIVMFIIAKILKLKKPKMS